MRPASLLSGPLRRFLPLLCLLACAGIVPSGIATAQTTTFTGKVYSPLGPASGDPIPNIFVFAVDPNYPPPVFTPGVTIGPTGQNNCALQQALVPTSVLGSAHTGADGSYTFNVSGTLPTPVTIVIQAGKWRAQFQYTNIVQGGNNALPPLSMPSSRSATTDLPRIAVVTGEADAIECIFNQIGISNSEITDPSGTGSINFFEGKGTNGGGVVSSSTPSEDALVSTSSAMDAYDLIMYGCQGNANDPDVGADANNLTDYTSNGGRVFSTHFEYIWLKDNSSFTNAATWLASGYSETSNTIPFSATVDTTYPAGELLAQWLQNVGALSNSNPATVGLTAIRVNTTAINTQIAQSQANLLVDSAEPQTQNNIPAYTGTPSMQFTFDTPIGAAGTPTVTIGFTNNTSKFLQGDVADSIAINVTNTSSNPTTAGLTLTLSLPGGVTATSLSGGANTGWVCTLATLTCVQPAPLAANTADPVTILFNISKTVLGQESLTSSLSGGGLSGGQQCGRVLYNDYHVETPRGTPTGELYTNGTKYCPSQTTLTNAQKFLEYSLYDISNFVSPSTSDLLTIQGPVNIVWPQPAAISYGTPLSATQLDATAVDPESNVKVPGTFVYTPAAGATPNAAPAVHLSVAFTPTDSVDYPSATGSVYIQINPDATTTALTNPNPTIFYGQTLALNSVETVTSNGPATTIDGGTVTFAINGTVVCTNPATAAATIGTTCTASALTGLNAATYTLQSAFSGDNNFNTSTSTSQSVVINPDPTTTTVVSSATQVYPSQSVTFTATLGDIYAQASGVINFFDGTTLLGSVPAPQGTASLSVNTFTIGIHGITACLVVSQNFLASCSSILSQAVILPPTIIPTATIAASALNPSVVGQSVTFTANVATVGAFISSPTGTVKFLDGTTTIGTSTLSGGVATFTTATLAVGTHSITALYIGSTTMGPSTSAIVTQVVTTALASAGTGFIMTVSPTTFNVGAGSSTSVAVSVLELNNFNQPVALTCSGLPAEATCNFGISTIPATGGATTLTISASAPHNCNTNQQYFTAQNSSPANTAARRGLPILATFIFLFFARRRRALKGLLLAALLCIIPSITGCGTCTDLGVKPGTYTFTVTGSANTNGVTPVILAPGDSASGGVITQTQTMTMTVTL